MNYYKVISGSTFIGVGTNLDMRRYQEKHKIILACPAEQAQYIQLDETLYHALWMLPANPQINFESNVEVIEITESEYNTLYSAIEFSEEIPVDEPQDDEPIVDENTEITVDFIRNCKVNEMNKICLHTIENGFDVVLSDGEFHHFSLTTQNQLDLIMITALVTSGETSVPYHADGELCKFYSKEDIITISKKATDFKTYHISYFNSLKQYILSLETINEISVVYYGMDIPEEYCSEILFESNNSSMEIYGNWKM